MQSGKNVLSMYVSSLDTAAEQMTTALYRLSSEYDMLACNGSPTQKNSSDTIEWYLRPDASAQHLPPVALGLPLMNGVFSYYDYGWSWRGPWGVRSATPKCAAGY